MFELLTDNFEQALLNYQIDIGFSRELPENKILTAQKISTEKFALVVPENHFLNQTNFTNLSAAQNENFILPSLGGRNNYAKLLREIFAEYDFAPKSVFESDFGATILSLVGKNLGVSLMPISYSYHSPPKVRFIETTHQTALFVVRRTSDANAVLDNFKAIIEQYTANRKTL